MKKKNGYEQILKRKMGDIQLLIWIIMEFFHEKFVKNIGIWGIVEIYKEKEYLIIIFSHEFLIFTQIFYFKIE